MAILGAVLAFAAAMWLISRLFMNSIFVRGIISGGSFDFDRWVVLATSAAIGALTYIALR